ncbi:MAG: DUF4157 domain-containing protein [Betaproteobacteria bacterium]|nr:MAG: DUF4157 domain-containing protein [Betaproteobacteria bacterium]
MTFLRTHQDAARRAPLRRSAVPPHRAPIQVAVASRGSTARCACGGACPRCRQGDASQQPQRGTIAVATAALSESHGSPLDPGIRAGMESRFGRDFGQVRIHTDASADASARHWGARAYTIGNHIVFAAGRFAPHTEEGRGLLAHELAHVEQQRAGRRGRCRAAGVVAEREARALGAAAASGQRVSVRAAAPQAIQRNGPEGDAGVPSPDAPQLELDPEIEALALRHLIRWWLGTALVEDSAPTEVSESGGAEEHSEVVPEAGVQLPVGAPLPPIVFQLPLQSSLFDPLPPDPLYIEPDVGGLFSGFHARGAPVGEGDMPVAFDIYRRNQAIAGALPDLRAIAPSFLRPIIPPTWRRDIAGALTGAAVGAYLNRDYMTPIEVSDRAWEAMTGAGTTMIPFPSVSF